MPRIRKKTSRRGTTRHREKIKQKMSQHYKKAKKQARKDKAAGKPVQKKSKKDPGIPNAFPYKDQILAEVAEHRRQAAVEKQRRREEKRAAAVNDGGNDPEETTDVGVDGNDGRGSDGIMSLKPAVVPEIKDSGSVLTERIPVFPGPLTLREVVQKADVVLHVVDARDPVAGMSDMLTDVARGKLVVLLNKADMVPRESLAQWLVHLRTQYTVLPFRVSSAFVSSVVSLGPMRKEAKLVPRDDALGLDGLWTYLNQVGCTKDGDELVVAVTGVTNAGKSAVVNSILGSDVFSVYNDASAKGPYTTTVAQEVVATMDGWRVRFIDTPGLQFVHADDLTEEESEAMRVGDILLRCRGQIERVKDPLSGVAHIVTRADARDLMLAYNLPAFLQGDTAGFLAGLARVSGLIKKRGMLDHAGAARMVLRDWRAARWMRYTMPGATTGAGDETVLAALRGGGGGGRWVRMAAGTSDRREVVWDGAEAEWPGRVE